MKILFYNKAVYLSFLLSLTLPLQAMDSELPLKHAVKKILNSDVFEEQKAEKLKYTFKIQSMPSKLLASFSPSLHNGIFYVRKEFLKIGEQSYQQYGKINRWI